METYPESDEDILVSVERIVSGDAKHAEKWREEKANLKVGDVVPVDSGTGDEWKKYSPEKMDRYAGSKRAREVTTTVYTQPITRLCPL